MAEPHIVIVGGGLSGLSAGCYALASGFRATIVEHNLALGGVCTAWSRPPYVIDGCIQWLTGGPFEKIYEELGVVPRVSLRTLESFVTYRDAPTGAEVSLTRDFAATEAALRRFAPRDGDEIARLLEAAERVVKLDPGIDAPVELSTFRDQLARLWKLRGDLGTVAHYRKPIGVWAREHLESDGLRRLFTRMLPESAPTLFLLMVLGYLKHGYLSRPIGGTAAFRDAVIDTYRRRGGATLLHSTVDEILVEAGRARGVRLADGSIVEADVVVSTASTPETIFRLLGGLRGAMELRDRLEQWKLFPPIVLASYGVAMPLTDAPSSSIIDRVEPLSVGGVDNEHLTLRVYNDEPSVAPPGHTVVQLALATDYTYWATRGARYNAEKDALGAIVLDRVDALIPGVAAAMRVTDVATPLTFWTAARAWRGAYEGWLPNSESMFGHVDKRLSGIDGLYLAGQWVEPGGGVPTAVMSGRQAVQLVCADAHRPFERRASTAPRSGAPA